MNIEMEYDNYWEYLSSNKKINIYTNSYTNSHHKEKISNKKNSNNSLSLEIYNEHNHFNDICKIENFDIDDIGNSNDVKLDLDISSVYNDPFEKMLIKHSVKRSTLDCEREKSKYLMKNDYHNHNINCNSSVNNFDIKKKSNFNSLENNILLNQ